MKDKKKLMELMEALEAQNGREEEDDDEAYEGEKNNQELIRAMMAQGKGDEEEGEGELDEDEYPISADFEEEGGIPTGGILGKMIMNKLMKR